MSAFRPRTMLKVARNMNQAVRSFSGQSSSNNAYRLPALFGGAVLAGSAFVALKNERSGLMSGIVPQVLASPPPPKVLLGFN